MNSIYLFNVWALILFIGACLVSSFIYRKSECGKKIVHIADLTQQSIIAVTLCSLIILLKDVSNLELLGQGLSFIIISNFYAAVFNTATRIYNALKK